MGTLFSNQLAESTGRDGVVDLDALAALVSAAYEEFGVGHVDMTLSRR